MLSSSSFRFVHASTRDEDDPHPVRSGLRHLRGPVFRRLVRRLWGLWLRRLWVRRILGRVFQSVHRQLSLRLWVLALSIRSLLGTLHRLALQWPALRGSAIARWNSTLRRAAGRASNRRRR